MNTILKKYISLLIFIIIMVDFDNSVAQSTIHRIEPPNWWVGMTDERLQLMIHGENIAQSAVKIDYPGVSISKVNQSDNPNFIFLDLAIGTEAKAGSFNIEFWFTKKKKVTYPYVLNERNELDRKNIDQSDVIYLITPDRFANGDPEIDDVSTMKEGKNREFHGGRHGGDIAGISSKLDYLEDLGVTTLWLNPVLENNMPEYSYHGYATTDYYKVDPRYGTNETYRKLTNDLHDRDMKMVMDMVFNHSGLEHWWMKDMPFKDWINYYPEYVNTNHALSALSDPYAAESDLYQMERGWFVESMPDLNQRNAFMANYLIQNSIWWIEYVGLDGIRMDTYPYNNKAFMKDWTDRVYKEYPDFYLVGETWVDNEAQEAYWAKKSPEDLSAFESGMNSITDFPLCFAIHKALKDSGDIKQVYDVLSKDFLYHDPTANMIFLDNHDMDRFYYTIGENLNKYKIATTILLTTRGIPQLYYGSEILMKKYGHHGDLREDFPGGWAGDKRDAFVKSGRTKEENEAFDYMRKLLNWRKTSEAVKSGTLKHFVPYDNIYVYNRKSTHESVLVIVNNNPKSRTVDMTRYAEIMTDCETATDVVADKQIEDLTAIKLSPFKTLVLKLNPEINSKIK